MVCEKSVNVLGGNPVTKVNGPVEAVVVDSSFNKCVTIKSQIVHVIGTVIIFLPCDGCISRMAIVVVVALVVAVGGGAKVVENVVGSMTPDAVALPVAGVVVVVPNAVPTP